VTRNVLMCSGDLLILPSTKGLHPKRASPCGDWGIDSQLPPVESCSHVKACERANVRDSVPLEAVSRFLPNVGRW
jgi:hypothetical protein